jgi:hypothetical protein
MRNTITQTYDSVKSESVNSDKILFIHSRKTKAEILLSA